MVGGDPYACFTDEKVWGTERGSNFPEVTELVRGEPMSNPTAPLPGILLQIPGTPHLPSSSSNDPGHFQSSEGQLTADGFM